MMVVSNNKRNINADTIIGIVCKALAVSKTDILSKNKTTVIVFARYTCLAMVCHYTGLRSPNTIGRIFKRNHSTIANAFRVIKDMQDTNNEKFMASYNKAHAAIAEHLN